jgi:glycosyltransferase involved in cell wall biosynthesis
LSDDQPKERDERLIMVLIVRDERDILEANLRYHHAVGVDRFVVTDNGSTDETPEILARFAKAGLVHVIDEPEDNYYEQERNWLTRMARIAATELQADWVLYGDADEFWLPAEGSLRDVLASIPKRYGAVVAPRTEFVGRPDGPGTFAERLTVREARSRARPKLAHRPAQDLVAIDRGGHAVAVAGPTGDVADMLRPPGRTVHRLVRDSAEVDPSSDDDMRLVWAPEWPVRILHFPVRSFAQFEQRAKIAASPAYPGWGRFERLRQQYEDGRLGELYAELVLDDEQVEEGIRSGRLVRDQRLRDLVGACPDPLTGTGPGTVRATPSPEELARELSDLEFDAMQLLGRTQGWLVLQRNRNRERIDELSELSKKLHRRNKRLVEQRDNARRKKMRLRRLLKEQQARSRTLREALRAERSRPWSRARRAVRRAFRR